MDEEFIRNRITELRLKKGISEYQLSLELGQNRGYIQAISSGRALPSMKQFLNICEYFEIFLTILKTPHSLSERRWMVSGHYQMMT